tara:strand:+ start:696 stop:815 length:120 start_codon:yes stop_codon:yes gene_type:complete
MKRQRRGPYLALSLYSMTLVLVGLLYKEKAKMQRRYVML